VKVACGVLVVTTPDELLRFLRYLFAEPDQMARSPA
jgi:hypothetical protein